MINLEILTTTEWMDIDELTQCLRLSKSTIYRIKRTGQLSGIRWGDRVRYRTSDVLSFLRERGIIQVDFQ